jgi:hypothetical protein
MQFYFGSREEAVGVARLWRARGRATICCEVDRFLSRASPRSLEALSTWSGRSIFAGPRRSRLRLCSSTEPRRRLTRLKGRHMAELVSGRACSNSPVLCAPVERTWDRPSTRRRRFSEAWEGAGYIDIRPRPRHRPLYRHCRLDGTGGCVTGPGTSCSTVITSWRRQQCPGKE